MSITTLTLFDKSDLIYKFFSFVDVDSALSLSKVSRLCQEIYYRDLRDWVNDYLPLSQLPSMHPLLLRLKVSSHAKPAIEKIILNSDNVNHFCDFDINANAEVAVSRASGSSSFKVWNLKTCALIRTVETQQPIHSLQISSDEKRAFSRSSDTFIAWNLETGAQIRSVPLFELIAHARISSDETSVLVAGQYGFLRLYNLETGDLIRILRRTDWPPTTANSCVHLSPDKMWALEGAYDASTDDEHTTINLWNLQTGMIVQTIKRDYTIRHLQMNLERTRVVLGSTNGQLELWNPETGECTLIGNYSGHLRLLQMNPKGTLLFSGTSDGEFKVWNLQTNQCIHTIAIKEKNIKAIRMSNDGNQIFVATSCGDLRIYRLMPLPQERVTAAARAVLHSFPAGLKMFHELPGFVQSSLVVQKNPFNLEKYIEQTFLPDIMRFFEENSNQAAFELFNDLTDPIKNKVYRALSTKHGTDLPGYGENAFHNLNDYSATNEDRIAAIQDVLTPRFDPPAKRYRLGKNAHFMLG